MKKIWNYLERKEVITFLLGISVVWNFYSLWMWFKMVKMVEEIGVIEPVCTIEEAFEVREEAICKNFKIKRIGERIVVTK